MARPIIRSLTGVRAVAAGWVLLFHVYTVTGFLSPDPGPLRPIITAGGLGVDFFFILSGFIISYTYLDQLARPKRGAYLRFLGLRLERIYPVHLVTVLLFAGLVVGSGVMGLSLGSANQYTSVSFVMNAALLQAVPPAFAWNNRAWSISAEFGAYLLFLLLARIIVRLRTRRATLAVLALVVSAAVIALALVVQNADAWPYWSGYVFIWLRLLAGFGVGCLVFWVWRSLRTSAAGARVAVPGAVAGAAGARVPAGGRVTASGMHWATVALVAGVAGVLVTSYTFVASSSVVHPSLGSAPNPGPPGSL